MFTKHTITIVCIYTYICLSVCLEGPPAKNMARAPNLRHVELRRAGRRCCVAKKSLAVIIVVIVVKVAIVVIVIVILEILVIVIAMLASRIPFRALRQLAAECARLL